MSKIYFANKLKIQGNKILSTVALILILTFSGIMASMPTTNAHTPSWTVPTWSYLVISPNPVGIGQTCLLISTVNWVPPGAGGPQGDRWRNLTIAVTKPDGSKETLGPFLSDPIGGSYTYYVPTQLGNYTFVFNFPGQVVSLYGPTGLASVNPTLADYINDTFLPSSRTQTLTVQQTPIAGAPTYPLPTSYWTRPIEGQNTAWASIASNWLVGAGPAATYNVQPYGIAPNSPHIMWTKPLQDGGVVGGTDWNGVINYYSGSCYEQRYVNPIIMLGRLYYDLPLGSSDIRSSTGIPATAVGGGYVCVDLRTGETIWWKNWTTIAQVPQFGQLYDFEGGNQHGVLPGILWSVDGTTWQAYDGLTGSWLYNLTKVPSTSIWGTVYGSAGEILKYVLNYNATARSGWLGLWNNTASPDELGAYTGTGSFSWRPNSKIIDMSTAYSWNVTIPSLQGNIGGAPIVAQVIPDDLLLGYFGTYDMNNNAESRNPVYTGFAISLKPASRGQLLWIKNYTTEGNVTRYWALLDVKNRVFTIADKQTMMWSGYSMDTGNLLWGPIHNEGVNDYDYYIYAGIGGYNAAAQSIANGVLYLAGMGGKIYARDTLTGNLLWTYQGNPNYLGDPWPLAPIYIGMIADGKIYTFTFEHSASEPLRKGQNVYCLNQTTGAEIWHVMGWSTQTGHSQAGGIIADGYLAYLNMYDNQIYCIGKGPSATTVTYSPVIGSSSSVLIQGTVIDTAAGTKQNEQAADFPNGVPAVSDASMGAWMDYVYMQKPRPADAIGVKVTLSTFDPNNNTYVIGTTTSDANGMYKTMWTPPVPGAYTIIATFAGSDSYYGSSAETAIGVSNAPTAQAPIATPAPTATPPPTVTSTPSPSPQVTETPIPPPSNAGVPTTYIIIAVVAIIIVVAAAALALRRRK
jgi:outer membrane protein assembly factor BamB